MRLAIIAAGAALASSGCLELFDGAEGVPSTEEGAERSASSAALEPPSGAAPPGVTVEKVTTGGSGCADPESLSVVVASDGTAFLAVFDEMTLDYPPGPPVQHLHCVASIKIEAPDGWRFSVATATNRGYAYLSDNQTAKVASKYFFSGQPAGGMKVSTLSGPHDGDYQLTEETSSAGWSKCGGQNIFHMHAILSLDVVQNKDEPAVLNGETADARFVKALAWQWERCGAPSGVTASFDT